MIRAALRGLGLYVAYQAFVLALTYPAVARLTTHGIGGPDKGARDHLWFVWWVEQVFWGDEASLGRITYVNHPDGYATLSTFHNVLNEVIEQPLHLLGPPVLVYNLVILISMAVAGLCAYAAVRIHVADRGAAFVAGLFYLCAPVIWCSMDNGESELATYYLVPVAYVALYRTVERRSRAWAATAGVVLALACYGAWYFGIEMLLFALLFVSVRAVQAWRGEGRPEALRVVALGAVAAVVCAAVIGPHVLVLRHHMHEDVIFTTDVPNVEFFFWPGTPPPAHIPHALERVGEGEFYNVYYLGWVLLLAAGHGFLRTRVPDRRLLLWLAVIFFVLTMGRFLRWGHHGTTFGEYLVPLPMMLLYQVRLFRGIHKSFRWVVLVRLLLGILAAAGLARLAGPSPLRRALVYGGATALFVAEFALVGISPATMPLELFDASEAAVPSVYRTVRDDPADVAVLELPADESTLQVSYYLFFQTYHHKRLIGPLAVLFEPRVYASIRERYRELDGTFRALAAADPDDDAELRAGLRELGLRYVVYHPSFESDRLSLRMDLGALRAAALRREIADDGTELFVLY